MGSILKDVFLIFPQYCLGRGLMDMATEMNINLIVAKFGFISERNRYSWDFLGKYMTCMVVQVSRTRIVMWRDGKKRWVLGCVSA